MISDFEDRQGIIVVDRVEQVKIVSEGSLCIIIESLENRLARKSLG